MLNYGQSVNATKYKLNETVHSPDFCVHCVRVCVDWRSQITNTRSSSSAETWAQQRGWCGALTEDWQTQVVIAVDPDEFNKHYILFCSRLFLFFFNNENQTRKQSSILSNHIFDVFFLLPWFWQFYSCVIFRFVLFYLNYFGPFAAVFTLFLMYERYKKTLPSWNRILVSVFYDLYLCVLLLLINY